jgi:hypothetical protein
LEIDRLTFINGAGLSVTKPMIQVTNTVVHIHNNMFIGAGRGSLGTTNQDAIVLGGTGGGMNTWTDVNDSANAPFYGLGSVIEANAFNLLRRGIYARGWVNQISVIHNYWYTENGCDTTAGLLEVDAGPVIPAGGANFAITENWFECPYAAYAIKMTKVQSAWLTNNQFFDPGPSTIYVRFEAGSINNLVMGSLDPARMSDAGTGNTGNSMLYNSGEGWSFYALSAGGVATHHYSVGGTGVKAVETTGVGVQAFATAGTGVSGTASSSGVGVGGASVTGRGVQGTCSGAGYGVYAEASGAGGMGIYGYNYGGGIAIKGYSAASTGLAGVSTQGAAVTAEHIGALTANLTAPALSVLRNVTLGAYAANVALLQVNDATAGGVADLVDLQVAGTSVAKVSHAGAFTSAGNPLGRKVSVPATATSTGALGDFAADASFFYVCTAANTWRRVAVVSW